MNQKLILPAAALLLAAFTLTGNACSSAPQGNNTEDSTEVKIMTFNLRYDNPDDGPHQWGHRREAVLRMIQDKQPGVIGIQEGLTKQVAYIRQTLPDYSFVGVGRDDGHEAGEFAAIFYNNRTYQVIDQGHFWLSETPDSATLGWDAACIRIATWAKLRDRRNTKEMLVVNTHFDHIGVVARQQSAKLLLERVHAFGDSIPAVIMGDFNFPTDDPSLAPLVNAPTFHDARKAALEIPQGDSLPSYTYRGFGHGEQPELIDHIFVQGFAPQSYEIITDNYGVPYLSDHLPVMATLKH